MDANRTLLISGSEVIDLLTLEECMTAVEHAFKLHAEGKAVSPKVLGMHTQYGGFHIKAGTLELKQNYFVTKINSNFADNRGQHGLPLIQGIIAVFDGANGRLLALIDSIEVTIIRTGAATGVATKYLAKGNAKVVTICGCGNQGRVSLRAIMKQRKIEKVFAFDVNKEQAARFGRELTEELNIQVAVVDDLSTAVTQSDICVTCTTSTRPFLRLQDVTPGLFIAAVGGDSEDKQELCAKLTSSGKLVVDLREQCAIIGELHHALQAQLMSLDDVHAELGEIITGKKTGRKCDEEIIIFDSTGTALQDVAAAAIIYERALKNRKGMKFNFAGANVDKDDEMRKKNQKAATALSAFFPFR